jgi:LacI family transcriptional regulator
MAAILRVAVVATADQAYGRGVMKGVIAYAHPRHRWIVRHIPPVERLADVLRAWRADGLIAHVNSRSVRDAVEATGLPVVNTSNMWPDDFPSVLSDDAAVGTAAAEHFHGLGLRQVLFVGDPGATYALQRRAGFLAAARRLRLEATAVDDTTPSLADALLHATPAQARLLDTVRSLPRPLGLFVDTDTHAAALLETLITEGLQVPGDVAVLGANNEPGVCLSTHPSLSSVIIPFERVALEAAALLDHLLSGGRPPRRPARIPPLGVAARASTDTLALPDPAVCRALRFLRSNAHQDLGILDVAHHAGLSRRTLERRFAALVGDTPLGELQSARLALARRLLESTDLPIALVAERCGFGAPERLSVAFRKGVGTTPRAYRQRNRVPDPLSGTWRPRGPVCRKNASDWRNAAFPAQARNG